MTRPYLHMPSLQPLVDAEDALLAFAQGAGADITPQEASEEAVTRTRTLAATAEAFITELAAQHPGIPADQAAWLKRRQPAYGWEATPIDPDAPDRELHAVQRAWQDLLDGLWRWTETEHEERLRAAMRALENALNAYAAAEARQQLGQDCALADWLDTLAQGAMF